MPIIPANPSPAIVVALIKGLQDLGQPIPDAAGVQGKHMFTVGLRTAAGAASIADARPFGWQFQVSDGKTTRFAEVSEAIAPGPVLIRLSDGDVVNEALRQADGLLRVPQVQAADFEARILRVHGLRIEAFWLKPPSGTDDLIVPYLSISNVLEKMRAFRTADFFGGLAELARRQLTLPDQTPDNSAGPNQRKSAV